MIIIAVAASIFRRVMLLLVFITIMIDMIALWFYSELTIRTLAVND